MKLGRCNNFGIETIHSVCANGHAIRSRPLERGQAAAVAISARRSGLSLSRRAAPPFLPSDCAALSLPESPMSSSTSPVKILATRIALVLRSFRHGGSESLYDKLTGE
jgi:hypothetical protein